jgi:hypothetical protein
MRDAVEGFANAAIGLLVSVVAVRVLRAVGAWNEAPAVVISGVFFGLSWGRSWALRWWFRHAG